MSAAEVPSTAPRLLAPTQIGGSVFRWGSRTYVMGIVNLTPDSFSGDGLLAVSGRDEEAAARAAVERARLMIEEGADVVDVGGESSRPGHVPVPAAEETARVLPALRAIREALPSAVVSIDTTKPEVAAAALDAGADLINDVWGTCADDSMIRLAATRGVPLVVTHNRATPEYRDFLPEMLSDLGAAVDRALELGVRPDSLILDPGFGFGKTPGHNLEVVRHLPELRAMGYPVLLGTSRKSTLGKVLGGASPEGRLEATLATTALGIAGGADMVRVHDVGPNVRAARMSDAVVRGGIEL